MNRLAIVLVLLVAACSTAPTSGPAPERSSGGGYYLDDGPGDSAPADLASIPDARPKVEPLSRFANRPYDALGNHYVPLVSVRPFHQRGIASWYGKRYHGRKTTSGEIYDMYAMTAAHPTLPIPSYARVTNVANGRNVVVRINDRGPFLRGRVIDLSYAAAYRLGIIANGSGEVEVDAIVPGQAEPTRSASLDSVAASVTPVAPRVAPEARSISPEMPSPPSPPLPDTVPMATDAPPAAPRVFLQLGAFTSRDNAESLRARLSPVEEPSKVLMLDNLWRLQLGPYRSQDDARSAAERLERMFSLKPLVVVR